MAKKSHSPPRRKARNRFREGASVVPDAGAFEGADPFVVYVVTAVHSDGTVDLRPTAGVEVHRVSAAKLWEA